MSEELLDILKANRDKVETQVALQCAPLLAGVKISNLLTIPQRYKKKAEQLFEGTGVCCRILYEAEEKTTFLLYEEQKLRAYLEKCENKRAMSRFGYGKAELEQVLEAVSVRYAAYMEERRCFPHEIGVLLGYPACDVLGFVDNQGKNFLYSGYWKVYGNLVETLRIFEAYERARESVILLINQGIRIEEIIEERKKLQHGA